MSSRSRSHRTALARHRLLAAIVTVVVGVTAAPTAGAGPPRLATMVGMPPGRVPPLRPPVQGPLARGFEPPSGPYGPGHRGIDLRSPPGAMVRVPAGGRVVFAGPVAGLRWVSVEVASGVVVTVGPLDRPVVAAGQQWSPSPGSAGSPPATPAASTSACGSMASTSIHCPIWSGPAHPGSRRCRSAAAPRRPPDRDPDRDDPGCS